MFWAAEELERLRRAYDFCDKAGRFFDPDASGHAHETVKFEPLAKWGDAPGWSTEAQSTLVRELMPSIWWT